MGVPSPVGTLWLVASAEGLRRVSFGGSGEGGGPLGRDRGALGVLEVVAGQLEEFFGERREEFEVPLDWSLSSGWALRVRRVLFETVGCGETVSYGELAARAGRPEGARAVGGIMAGNPIPVVVPCHRVIAADGGLGGFAGSGGAMVEMKRKLLEREGSAAPTLFDL
ncbi:methylated-DNA--[protein]-cysteine S-methyltransferase [Stackebrandtia sp.]|uniref:methylated-DNA--[protein]-cysteine S-methyltransferase n=1 Tax=Stackebrandtia sp. TaxID=2023065 RepID=UPI0039C9042E